MEEYTYEIVSVIKNFWICLGTIYTDSKMLGIKCKDKRKNIGLVLATVIISLIYSFINEEEKFKITNFIFLIIANSAIFAITYKNDIAYSIIINSISLAINQMILFVATMMSYMPIHILNIDNEYIEVGIIIISYLLILGTLWKFKRIRNGISFLKKEKDNEYLNLIVLAISVAILFAVTILTNYQVGITSQFGVMLIIFSIIMCITIQKSLQLYYKHKMLIKTLEQTKEELERGITSQFGVMLIIFSIIMCITIQKSLQLYYKHKMLIKTLEQTKEELESAKSDVKKLEEENLNFSKISHTIAHKQKALQHKLEMLSKSNDNIETEKIKEQINDVTKELKQSLNVELTKTGIEEIDNMLDYMQSECIKNNIEFQLQVSGNIYHMINNYISEDDLETILADHIKDAIIAIKHIETTNRKILVRLGKINGVYAVYFCDTGVEFEINTLMELGKKPATTYKDEGGTGMGFMNTFDTLEKTRASLIIEEMSRPKENNFTKIIKVVFDNKKEYKIVSYRYQEIEKQKTRNNLIIEKL